MYRQEILEHARLVNAVVGHGGSMEPVEVMPAIARSWNRCAHEFGLDPSRDEPVVILSGRELKDRQEPLARLRAIAQGEMATLYQQLSGSGFSVLLTDRDGVVLDYLGDPSFTESAAETGMVEGAWWNERHQGTNGMGTCAMEQRPILVHHNEHYLSRNVGLTCSAAPIFDHDGQLMAVLDASSFSHMAQQHTLVLVNMSAQMIENRAFLCRFREQYALRFHSRPEFIGTLWEGALALDEGGRILAANRSALFQLGHKKPGDLVGRTLPEIFNTGLDSLLGRKTQGWLNPVPLYEAKQGSRFFGLIRPPEHRPEPLAPPPRRAMAPNATGSASARLVRLDALQFGDPTMEYNVRCAKRVLARDIPILLSGETGTGKEVFAQAFHNSGPRRDGPFVAINCAAIPGNLIEAELFGYTAGAYTGARGEGARGKLREAHGGTLFLDEIGDMPLKLQAVLLRVLETRRVTPLGGGPEEEIDLSLVCASHRSLKALCEVGEFRSDLYFRLSAMSLALPPLRERSDLEGMARRILQEESPDRPIRLATSTLDLIRRHPWPGNIRQLKNALRLGVAMLGDDEETLGPDHLPQDLLDGDDTVHPVPAAKSLRAAEVRLVEDTVQRHNGNISAAARELGITRTTLYRKLRQTSDD